jgi:hypothetical protein
MKTTISIYLFIALISYTSTLHLSPLASPRQKLPSSAPSAQQIKLDHLQEEKVEDSDVFHKPTLFWFHAFVANSGTAPKHPKNTVTGYESEEELRMKRDGNLDKIDSISRKESYTKRDIQHRILKLKNEIDRNSASLHSQELMATQRSTAMKFEVNHDMMWKAYYGQRLKLNMTRLQASTGTTSASIKALMKNDKSRMKFYQTHASEQYHALTKLEGKNNVLSNTIAKPLRVMGARIALLRLKGEREIRKLQTRIKELQRTNLPIEAALKKDQLADLAKRGRSKKRSTQTDTQLSRLLSDRKHRSATGKPKYTGTRGQGPTALHHLPQNKKGGNRALSQNVNYWGKQ